MKLTHAVRLLLWLDIAAALTIIDDGFLVSIIQVCVNTMPRREDISNDLREASVAPHQSISKQCGVRHLKMTLQASVDMLDFKVNGSMVA